MFHFDLHRVKSVHQTKQGIWKFIFFGFCVLNNIALF